MKKLSLFGSNWKPLIIKISIEINEYTHKDPKSQVEDFSAVCLHFTAILVKFAEKTSAIKSKSSQ